MATDVRTLADVERAVRSLCRHFRTDHVIIIGSQAALLEWPDAPIIVRTSGEIDAYPGNIREWEDRNQEPASEEINALFGWGSTFHEEFGFYIDGVDDRTAKLPPDWRAEAVTRTIVDDGGELTAIAPSARDLIVSKLHRLTEKDKDYISAFHAERPLDIDDLLDRLAECRPDARCLIPGFDGAVFSRVWKEALWVRFTMGAPQRQRRSVERYSIVKRA